MKLLVIITILMLHLRPTAAQPGRLMAVLPAQTKGDTAQVKRLLQQSKTWLEKDKGRSNSFALKALQLARQSNSPRHLAQCYSQLANLYRNQRDASLYICDSFTVVYSQQAGDSIMLFNALQIYATDLLNDNQTEAAWNYIAAAAAIADSLQQKPLSCKSAHITGFYYYKKLKPKEARLHFEKSLALALETNNEASAANNKLFIANAILYTGKRDSTTALFFEVINYHKKAGSYLDLGRAYSDLAFAYQAYGNMPKAIEYYQLSAHAFSIKGAPLEEAHAYLNLTPLYTRLKNFDTAKWYLQKGEAIFTKLRYTKGMALAKIFGGQFYSAQGDTEKAALYFKAAAALNKAVNDPTLRMANDGYAGLNLMRAGKQKEADSVLNIAIRQMRNVAPKELMTTALVRLKENGTGLDSAGFAAAVDFVNGKTSDTLEFDKADTALNPYTAANVASDSSIHAVFNKQLVEQETRYKTKELADSIMLQQQELLISRQQVAKRNLLLAAAIVVLTLLGILVWQQTSRRRQAEAARKRAEADKVTIGNLLTALNHSTGNYLKKFSSFITFSKAKHGTEEGLQEVEERLNAVMALQQMLSKNSMDTFIKMDEYLLSICSNLLQVFETDRMISLAIQAPLQMDSRMALIVGQLVNELVTNSFKYAFAGRATGEIRVVLRQQDDGLLRLSVSDNGIGLPPHVERSTGMDLIEGFCNQLEGDFSFSHSNGTDFNLQFATPTLSTKANAKA